MTRASARITVPASGSEAEPSTVTRKGRSDRSTAVAVPVRISAPNDAAWARIDAISVFASTPFSKPGKFSTTVVVVSCPPGSMPS